jgi:hypothetical protein
MKERLKIRAKWLLLLGWLLLAAPGVVQAQVNYAVSGNTAYVAYSPNACGNVVISNIYDGYPVTSIGEYAFWECTSLTSVTIPDSVTNIGDYAFEGTSLTDATIGNGVISIGILAFYQCFGLTSVTIPGSVTSIAENAFYECYDLTNIAVDAANPIYASSGGVVFNKALTTLILCPGGLTGSYVIPNGVTNIGNSAFWNCTSLTSVTLPNSVTSIGYAAFENCYSLTSVTIPDSVTNIGDYAFFDCGGLTSVTIPNSVTGIGNFAFEGTSLTNVTIPNGVTSIGDSAFYNCQSLTSVTIPNSVTGIGNYAFEGCISLTRVYFTGNAPLPTNDSTVFYYDYATVYYLPGTTGWGAMFDGLPTAPWFLPNPQILNHSASFGVQPGGFGFTISWATNASVVVQAATNLASPVWIPVSTITLIGGTNYFSDPQWTNYPMRFYRAALAYTVGGTLTGLPAGDTVTLQDNGSDNLTLSTNGTFTFPTALPNGHAYSVTISGTGGGLPITCTLTNGSGTISGANVTNVAVQSTYPALTGNLDVDMYNAAAWDGTDNGGVPGVMLTENGGPFRVTARGVYTIEVAFNYPQCVFATIVGTNSCSSTTFPSGTVVIQFGTVVVCGSGPYGY